MHKVYLAQSLCGYDDHSHIHESLKRLLRESSFEVYDPLEFEVNIDDPHHLVKTDLSFVDQANLIVADLTFPSLGGGTFGEIYHAHRAGKPIFLIQPPANYGPWMRVHTTRHYWDDGLAHRLDPFEDLERDEIYKNAVSKITARIFNDITLGFERD
jgi:nucleoside 2-deoxyribosyltransferase